MSSLNRVLFALLVISAAVAAPRDAEAQVVLVSNIDIASGGGGNVGSDEWYAQSFSTPAITDYTLNSIALKLKFGTASQGTFSVALWSSAGNGQPAAQQLMLSSGTLVNSLTSSFANYTFNSPSPLTLSGNSSYFVVLSTSDTVGNSGLVWGDTSTQTASSTGPGQIGVWNRSNTSGASWTGFQSDFPFQMTVMATPVPEPATYGVIAAGILVSFAAVRRLRRQHAAA